MRASPTSTCSTATRSPVASPTSGSRGCAQNQPVYRHPEPDGPGFWVITKHADVIQCNRDAARSRPTQSRAASSGSRRTPMPQTEAEEAGGRLMLIMDPPDHTRYRKLVNRGFTPRMIGAARAPHPRAHEQHPRCGARRRASATSSSTSPPSCRSRSSPS